MRTLLSSLVVIGVVAGAVSLGTSHAANSMMAAPKTKKKPPILNPLMPLTISEEGMPLTCNRMAECTIKGKLGSSPKLSNLKLISLVGNGKKHLLLASKWETGTVKFKLPGQVMAGAFDLTIVDGKQKPLSNKVRLHVTLTPEQIAAANKADCASARDADGDGHDATQCGGDDCDDSDQGNYPGNAEVCDAANHDEDCDPATFGLRDSDGDRHPDARCCNGTNCGNDCDDARIGSSPTASEVCNQLDDDCDGNVDEALMLTAYRDSDKDLYGDKNSTVQVCPQDVPLGYVTNNYDCDDTNIAKKPGGGC